MANVLTLNLGAIANDSTGDALRTALTRVQTAVNGIAGFWAGTIAPASPQTYMMWFDTTSTPAVLKIFDGTSWVAAGTLNITTHLWTPGAATFTGDATGTFPNIVLSTAVNASPGTFGSGVLIPIVTANNKGQITAISTVTPTVIPAAAGTLTGTTLAANVLASSLTSVGTLTGGAVGAGFTVALNTATITGQLALARLPSLTALTLLGNPTNATAAPAAVLIPYSPPQGRLTLTTAVPVLTSSVTGATTVYYALYRGNQVPIAIAGGGFTMATIAQLSNILANSSVGNAGPAAVAASSVYDLFIWSNAGTPTLTRGPAWTSGTVRSAGTALVMNSGLLTNNVAITNGPASGFGVYVGTIATNASSTVDFIFGTSAANGGASTLNVWNCYNRITFGSQVMDSTASWVYATASWRAANNSTTNRITFVTGLAEDGMVARSYCGFSSTSMSIPGQFGVGLDSTTALSGSFGLGQVANVAERHMLVGDYTDMAPLGSHFIQAIELGGTGNTFYAGGAESLTLSLPM